MLGFYNYTVVLTYIGVLTGFIGILFAASGNIYRALLCLIIAGICDMFDGAIASTMQRTRQEKRFGVQIDSLSDLICFGMLPSVIVYAITEKSVTGLVFAMLHLLCALIRLAWFNVDEEERQDRESTSRNSYLGMPVMTTALLAPAVIELGELLSWRISILAPFALLAISVAYLTPFHCPKPHITGKIILLLIAAAEFAFSLWRL